MQRTQFTFYDEWYRRIRSLSKKADRADAYEMICEFLIFGKTPYSTPNLKALHVFDDLFPVLEKERRLSEEGRRCAEYKAWRKAVYDRDDYTCQMCGARGVKLNAHHIFPYAYFPEKRYDIKNGITLCIPCHQKWHKENKHGG